MTKEHKLLISVILLIYVLDIRFVGSSKDEILEHIDKTTVIMLFDYTDIEWCLLGIRNNYCCPIVLLDLHYKKYFDNSIE